MADLPTIIMFYIFLWNVPYGPNYLFKHGRFMADLPIGGMLFIYGRPVWSRVVLVFFRVDGRALKSDAAAPAGSARPGRPFRRAGARGGGRSAIIQKQKTAIKRKSKPLQNSVYQGFI
jgi:hypothetical protein